MQNETQLTRPTRSGELIQSHREQTEIQAAIVSAKHFPRNEVSATLAVTKSFSRQFQAEAARYSFPRSGKTISGPSVDCARELARLWGNIRYGIRIISLTDDQVHIRGFAIDLESNSQTEYEDSFKPLIQRRGRDGETRWVQPDERDLRELISRRGAILYRNAILSLLPPDLVDAAVRTAEKTVIGLASGELKTSREDVVKSIVSRFDTLGVSVPMLEAFLGHGIGDTTAEELGTLKQVGKSIADGMTRRDEVFYLEAGRPETSPIAKVKERLKKTAPEG